jgi:hypothetical protein
MTRFVYLVDGLGKLTCISTDEIMNKISTRFRTIKRFNQFIMKGEK